VILLLICAAAAAYQIAAILACYQQLRRPHAKPRQTPAVSILKPIYGLDDHFYRAIVSQASQDYPEFEILFGYRNPDEPALPVIRKLQAEFPQVQIRIIQASTLAPNAKAGVLEDLSREARYPIRVVNDSDIAVERDYLRTLVSELQEAGLVTCLYRATASSLPGKMEALGIATEFAPSTLVAPLVGVKEFGLGSTLAFRAADLEAIGGFAAVSDYIADDYQVGKQLSDAGHRVLLSSMVVETHIHASTWSEVWHHQVRWAATIRVSRSQGYAGFPVTFATLWALLAMISGHFLIGFLLLAIRLVSAAMGCFVLRDWQSLSLIWLTPLRDLFGVAVWGAGLVGNEVRWRDRRLLLSSDGRIHEL
jgi:ceramide glucosyltransferase